MSASRTARRLLRCYPSRWRNRYGEELEALVVDMSDGHGVTWRTRADVIFAGGRERLRAAGLSGGGNPDAGARAGACLVLWTWALFVFAGAVLQKTSEHWSQALPARGSAVATVAFEALIALAVVTGLVVVGAFAVSGPSVRELLRQRGWQPIRHRVRTAAVTTLVLIAATVGLIIWAHGLSAHQRNGADALYAGAFVVWALLGLGVLLTWTAAAVKTERYLRLSTRLLRAQVRLAGLVAAGMGLMTVTTAIWWVAVADRSPAALTGSRTSNASAAVPQLIFAVSLMIVATGLGTFGARRAASLLRPSGASDR